MHHVYINNIHPPMLQAHQVIDMANMLLPEGTVPFFFNNAKYLFSPSLLC